MCAWTRLPYLAAGPRERLVAVVPLPFACSAYVYTGDPYYSDLLVVLGPRTAAGCLLLCCHTNAAACQLLVCIVCSYTVQSFESLFESQHLQSMVGWLNGRLPIQPLKVVGACKPAREGVFSFQELLLQVCGHTSTTTVIFIPYQISCCSASNTTGTQPPEALGWLLFGTQTGVTPVAGLAAVPVTDCDNCFGHPAAYGWTAWVYCWQLSCCKSMAQGVKSAASVCVLCVLLCMYRVYVSLLCLVCHG
mgnify:CR=1 FL=1